MRAHGENRRPQPMAAPAMEMRPQPWQTARTVRVLCRCADIAIHHLRRSEREEERVSVGPVAAPQVPLALHFRAIIRALKHARKDVESECAVRIRRVEVDRQARDCSGRHDRDGVVAAGPPRKQTANGVVEAGEGPEEQSHAHGIQWQSVRAHELVEFKHCSWPLAAQQFDEMKQQRNARLDSVGQVECSSERRDDVGEARLARVEVLARAGGSLVVVLLVRVRCA